MTVEDLKSIEAQLSIQKLLNREVVAKIAITDQDVTDFYNSNKAQFNVASRSITLRRSCTQERTTAPQPERRRRNHEAEPAKGENADGPAEQRRGLRAIAMIIPKSEYRGNGGTWVTFRIALNQSDPALKKVVVGLKAGQVRPAIKFRRKTARGILILKLIPANPRLRA